MNIELSESNDDLPILKRIKTSLKEKFNANSEGDLDKAIELANYMLALGQNTESQKLLDSFVKTEYEDEYGHLWPSHTQGITLLAAIAGMNGDKDSQVRFTDYIRNVDVHALEYDDPYPYFEECLKDHKDNMEYAMTESHKYKCSVIGQEALTFLNLLELLPYYEASVPGGHKADLERLVDFCYSELKKALLGRSRGQAPLKKSGIGTA